RSRPPRRPRTRSFDAVDGLGRPLPAAQPAARADHVAARPGEGRQQRVRPAESSSPRPRLPQTGETVMRRVIVLVAVTTVIGLSSSCSSGSGRTLVAEFTNVGDLVGRANVQQSDAVVGSIQKIELVQHQDDWLAKVTMSLRPEARVTQGTRAIVRSTSLLGEKYVDLVP